MILRKNLGLYLTALLSISVPAHSQQLSAAHPFVTDGDTLKFSPHLRVRLYGIDAPELHQNCDDGAWPAGVIAREALVEIIGGRPVTCEQVDWDSRWGRPVSRCLAGDTDVSAFTLGIGVPRREGTQASRGLLIAACIRTSHSPAERGITTD